MTLSAPVPVDHAVPSAGWRWLRRLGWAVLILTGAACLALTVGFWRFVGQIAPVEPGVAARTDGIVVLTGGSQRIGDALNLLAAGKGRRLLISGVHERTTKDELARLPGMDRTLLDCCVDLGRSARNTIGNAIEARRWARSHGFSSLLVVTSNYHLPRTLREFSHAIEGVRLTGHPIVGDSIDIRRIWLDPGQLKIVGLEYAKHVLAGLRQIVETDPEHSRLPVLVGRQKPVAPHLVEPHGPSRL